MLTLLLVTSTIIGTDPVAIAKAEMAFALTDKKKTRCSLCDDCPCTVCGCPDIFAKPVPAPVLKPKVVTQAVVAHVGVNGHTHACPNKECPFRKQFGEAYVWGGPNHGHACPFCETTQTVVSNKPATVVKTVQVAEVAPQTIQTSLASLQSAASYSSACANGQCSSASSARRGLFRR